MDVISGTGTPSRRGFLWGSAAVGMVGSLGLEAPAAAAEDASVDLALSGARGVRTGSITGHDFSMLGLTWRGGPPDADLRVRTRRHGSWSRWRRLRPLHDRPDTGVEGRADLRATEPLWTGECDAVDVRGADGGLPALTLALIAPGPAPALRGSVLEKKATASPKPDIVKRAAWGANESWRNGGPWFNHTIKQVHVHHTVNSNDYAQHEVPALLRSIYRYHTKSLGWSDVGYNFLVDRFGTIWQGRYGGSRLPVRGAHTLGFNNTSTGIAVIGNFEEVAPSQPVLDSLVHLAAWKLDKYGRQPSQSIRVSSQGSDKYSAGKKVTLPVIDGHRDTNDTACPGRNLYAKLPAIRKRAQARVDRYS